MPQLVEKEAEESLLHTSAGGARQVPMTGEALLDGGLPMPPPPPPTLRSSARDSNFLGAATRSRRSSTLDEDDLSFMDKEIKRLHRDMANMLAKETPLGDDLDLQMPSTPSAPSVQSSAPSGGRDRGGRGEILRRTSLAGDSEFDYSDDDDGIAILKDDLRTTTELFFERLSPEGRGQKQEGRPNRRASAYTLSPQCGSVSCSPGNARQSGRCSSVRLRERQSWNALEELERGVSGMMRRQVGGPALADPQSAKTVTSVSTGSGCEAVPALPHEAGADIQSVKRGSGDGGSVHEIVPPQLNEKDDQFPVDGLVKRETAVYRRSFSLSSRGAKSGEATRRRDSGASVSDLKARSEKAARTLKALKMLLVEEGLNGDEDTPSRDMERHSRSGKLWPVSGGEKTSEVSPSTVTGCDDGDDDGRGGHSSMRMKLLLQAIDSIQQINADLKDQLKVSRRRTTGGREERKHRRPQLRRLSSMSRAMPGGRHSLGRQSSQRRLLLEAGAQPRSSSDLLRKRRSEKGQAEPMSCGVPRHRVQVSKGGNNNVVYFELVIMQARSTWTLERRMDEFVELRRSLVATATDLAAAEGAANRERPAARAGRKLGLPSLSFPATGSRGSGSVGSAPDNQSGKSRSITKVVDARLDFRRQAEERVPQLPPERNSWFDSTRIWSVMSSRKREEKLTETQVHLASWLANVLADRELVSPDLVRFLGGDSGGVQAQPVVEDVFASDDDDEDDDDLLDAEDATSWSRSSSGVDDVASSDDDDDTDDSLVSEESDSLGGSLRMPEERGVAKRRGGKGVDSSGGGGLSARHRLEGAMGKRLACQAQASGGWESEDVGEGAEMSSGEGTETDEETEEAQQSMHLKETFSASVDASTQPRVPSPSPVSPTRRVTLDAFFQAPT